MAEPVKILPVGRRRLRSNTALRTPEQVHRRDLQDAIERLNRIGKTFAPPVETKPGPAEPAHAVPATAMHERAAKALFEAAFGSLKGKKVFGDDAVEFQREMREEWR